MIPTFDFYFSFQKIWQISLYFFQKFIQQNTLGEKIFQKNIEKKWSNKKVCKREIFQIFFYKIIFIKNTLGKILFKKSIEKILQKFVVMKIFIISFNLSKYFPKVPKYSISIFNIYNFILLHIVNIFIIITIFISSPSGDDIFKKESFKCYYVPLYIYI